VIVDPIVNGHDRDLYETKWNYIYSFAILTQPEWMAIVISDNLLTNCIRQDIDSYLVARKVWKEDKYRVGDISMTLDVVRDQAGKPVIGTNGR